MTVDTDNMGAGEKNEKRETNFHPQTRKYLIKFGSS